MDTTVEQMNIGGFRENSIRTVRIIGAMNRVIQDVSIKKSLHGIQNKQFRRSGFYELIRKSEKIEPIYYLDRLSWYPYFEQLAKAGLDQLVDDF